MATLYSISEQVRSLLSGGDPPAAAKVEMEEVKRYVIQVINGMLKTQHFSQTMAGSENIPDGLVLAEYDGIAVEQYKNTARCVLPIMPVSLPINLGIFHVSKTDDIINGFIPFQPGQLQMIGEETLISDVIGQVAYEPRGKYLIFNYDITTNDTDNAITQVYLLLVVKDLSLYGDFDLLPIAADMEMSIIQAVFQMLMSEPPPEKKVDVIDKQTQTA
jgi:hypothetical protein